MDHKSSSNIPLNFGSKLLILDLSVYLSKTRLENMFKFKLILPHMDFVDSFLVAVQKPRTP